jgi:SAM-dependent methyltransferase
MDSADWDRRYAGRELLWSSEPNRFLVQQAESLTPARALDLACGEGRNAMWLAQRGWQVTGVDFSAVGIEKARQLEDARGVHVEWVTADLLDYRPEPQGFDLVIVFYLQLPAEQRTPILRAAAGRRRRRRYVPARRARQQQHRRRARWSTGSRRAVHRRRRRLRPPGHRPRDRAFRAGAPARGDIRWNARRPRRAGSRFASLSLPAPR